MHYVKANGTDKPERVKIRAPTLANVQAVKQMLKDRYLADMPIVIAAIDPCFSCTDRLISIDYEGSKDKEIITWEALHTYSLDWYKQKGLDLTEVSKKFVKRMK